MDLLFHWFQEPMINEWYARGKHWSFEDIKHKYLPRVQGKDNTPSFIIYKEDRSIGFIQYYCLTEHLPEGIRTKNHPLFKSYQPNQLVGIDLFVADEEHRGKGLGTQILNCFMLKLPMSIKAVIVDPDSNNYKAIRCYVKAGFQPTNYSKNKAYLLLLKILPKTSS